MISSQPQQKNAASEQLAKVIALKIIAFKSLLAESMNNRVNQLSKALQKRLLVAFCIVTGICLMLCLAMPYRKTVNVAAGNYQPTHIGLPSYMPKLSQSNSTDSLTIKK